MNSTPIVIITGLSGSGKSTAIKALEDSGFFCIDNLPLVLLPKLLDLKTEFTKEELKLALVMDLREKEFSVRYHKTFESLRVQGYNIQILFLEASDECLIRRYSQTRRQHPLGFPGSLADNIRRERELLGDLRKTADRIIDTTHLTIHELREIIILHFTGAPSEERMRIDLLSFGYKFGIPSEADLVMDVRFLPNPFFIPDLKPKTGRDAEVFAFVMEQKETHTFLEKFSDLLLTLIPLYRREGKSYLTIAVGCTGGRHRSVAVAEALAEFLERNRVGVFLKHRDIDRE
ncbi:MAG: RNase adapter RapZ [Deltaproteobacteria bacterium]|nr:RNase adapter RapZ [Deltaproteobacteria bacterium]